MKPINEEIIFKITKRASLKYDGTNPKFVAFENMNHSAAKSSARKLNEAGYQAKVSPIVKTMIIVEREVSAFGNPM